VDGVVARCGKATQGRGMAFIVVRVVVLFHCNPLSFPSVEFKTMRITALNTGLLSPPLGEEIEKEQRQGGNFFSFVTSMFYMFPDKN
jgi:hypothetical protein